MYQNFIYIQYFLIRLLLRKFDIFMKFVYLFIYIAKIALIYQVYDAANDIKKSGG